MTSGRGRSLRVDIAGDADKLKRELAAAQRAVREAERDLARMNQEAGSTAQAGTRLTQTIGGLRSSYLLLGAAVAGASAAFAGGLATVNQMVGAASRMEEAQARSNTVFGLSSSVVNKWAQNSASAFLLSEVAAIDSVGALGNLFTSMDIGQDSAAQMSIRITELAADMASFNNVTNDEALVALRSAIVGEFEPLRRFGAALSAAQVENKALAMGLATTKSEIDETDKIMARYQLILERTTNQQGDVARTSGSLANQQKLLQANLEDLRVEIGNALVPAFTDATIALNEFLDANGEDIARGIAAGIDAMTVALGGFAGFVDDLRKQGPIVVAFRYFLMGGSPGDGRLEEGVSYTRTPFGDIGTQLPTEVLRQRLLENPSPDPDALGEAAGGLRGLGGPVDIDVIVPAEVERELARFQRATDDLSREPNLALIRRQMEQRARRSAGGGGSSRGGGAGGGTSPAEMAAADATREYFGALRDITRDHLGDLADAYLEGGAEQVEVVKQQQAEMLREVAKKANELREVLGVDLADAMILAKTSIDAVAEAEAALAKQREEEARRQRMDAFGVTSTLIDMGVGVEEAIRLGNEALNIPIALPEPVAASATRTGTVGAAPAGSRGADADGGAGITQHITVQVTDGSEAAIANATMMGGLELAHQLRAEGI